MMLRSFATAPIRSALPLVAGLAFVLAGAPARAQVAEGVCGNPFVNNYGPYDYRVERGSKLKIVEDYHFGPRVEGLVSGMSGSLEAELAYTLRAYPNHHRALVAVKNLAARRKPLSREPDAMPLECHFVRAVRFRPDDTIVRLIYAQFLAANARKPEALKQVEFAATLAKDNAFSHYNIGLVSLEIGEPGMALAHAHRSMELGLERPDLKQRLQAMGRWTDPPAEPPPAKDGAAPPVGGAASGG